MAARSKLSDLNDYLFEQLDRLTNDDIKGEALEEEIRRSQAVSDISKTIIENAAVVLKAAKMNVEYGRVEVLEGLIEQNE